MYFICNQDEKKSDDDNAAAQYPEHERSVVGGDVRKQQNAIFRGNKNNGVKRVYGRARANLCFSSFYIFCEDFRKQLEYMYAHESELYRKSLLSHMWKHLNNRDKHKYYETATKARTTYNLPEHPYQHPGHLENDREKSTANNKSPGSNYCMNSANDGTNHLNGSNVIGKLVKVQFSKSCTTPIITPLKVQDVVNHLASVRVHLPSEKPAQDRFEPFDNTGLEQLSPAASLPRREEQQQEEGQCQWDGGVPTSSASDEDNGLETAAMLQQYQQQPDYTPYGGYGVQPNAGYFNYAATESSWYSSPSSAVGSGGGDHALMHGGLSQHNACNAHAIGDTVGNFLNNGGYHHQTTPTAGSATSSTESFAAAAANQRPDVPGANMDPMVDFLGHQNINGTHKIKEESIDWLSTIINDDGVDHQGNRQDGGEGGGSSGGSGNVNGKLATGDLSPHKAVGQESNGRLPNFHQAFGSTEIGRFSQHEYYEPPKDTGQIVGGECQGQQGPTGVTGSTGHSGHSGRPEEHQQQHQPSPASFEPPRQQSRRGRTQRGGGQHRRNNKQTRTAAAAAAAAAAVAAQQYVGGYDVTGSAAVAGAGRHQHQIPSYHHHHHDPYGRNQQYAQQRYHHQEYHHHHQQPSLSSSYQHHQQEYYPRPYDRMHHGYQQQQHQQQQQQQQLLLQQQQQQQQQQHQQQQQSLLPQHSMNHHQSYYNNNREQSYAAGVGYNRFHSCCSTEHSIARPNHHHNYAGGSGQYYGDYNTSYNQW